MSVSLLLVVINSSAFSLFPSYLLLSSLQAFRFPRSLSYYLIFILPYPSLALAPVPLLPPCKRSLSLSLLWSYLHPGTWLQIITQEEEREKLSFYLQPQLQFIVELWMTEINSTPSLSPSLPFFPLLSSTFSQCFLLQLVLSEGWKDPASFECPILNLLHSSCKLWAFVGGDDDHVTHEVAHYESRNIPSSFFTYRNTFHNILTSINYLV